MRCLHCGADNSEDSIFCKSCGRRATPHAQKPEVVDFEKLLTDGYDALHAAKTGPALLAAETILRYDPSNTSALALKALVHERNAEIDLAIDAYEQLVAENPDSTQDRRRLVELKARGGRQRLSTMPARPDHTPLITAVLTAAIVLIAVVTFTIVILRNQNARAAAAEETPRDTQVASALTGTPAPGYSQNPDAWRYQQQTPAAGQSTPSSQPSSTESSYRSDQRTPAWLPPAEPINIAPEVPAGPTGSGGTAVTGETGGGEPVVMDDSPPPDTTGPREVIEVSVTGGRGGGDGGVPRDQQALSLIRIARSEQQQGNYRKAIEAYTKALTGVTHPGSVYQAIALCHYRLGENGPAAEAYRKAIQAYERQVQAGFEPQSARSGIASCQSGLRVCGEA
jgi:tetratricopeptide (TPR) repeat protein